MFRRYLKIPILVLAALISLTANSQDVVTYFHTDIVGSPVAATDAYGNTVWTEDYAPFGERWTVDADAYPNRQWFTDHTEDRETGLIYAGARYYDSQTARFLSRDPAAVVAEQPFTFNRYAYANNNPYAYVDPNGKSVYSRAIKVVFNGGDFALTFAGVYEDWHTLDVDSTASGWEKGVAFVSILSELAPVSVRDTKDLYRWMNRSDDAARSLADDAVTFGARSVGAAERGTGITLSRAQRRVLGEKLALVADRTPRQLLAGRGGLARLQRVLGGSDVDSTLANLASRANSDDVARRTLKELKKLVPNLDL